MSTSVSEPGYQAIAEWLRDEIRGGTLDAGAQLPSIGELSQRYRTTAVTVRRALRRLEDEGLVRVEHGVGSFVADWSQSYDALHLPSFSAEVAHAETVVLRVNSGVRNAEASGALGLPKTAELTVLVRVRRVAGVPIVFQRSYVPDSLAQVAREYRSQESLYALLRKRTGRVPVSADERLQAVTLPPDAAEALDVSGLGWRSLRTTFDAADRPLVFDEAFFPAERVTLRVQRRARQTTVGFEVIERC